MGEPDPSPEEPMSAQRLRGVIAAAATPLKPDWSIDLAKLTAHCRWLLDHGCDGINLLGTTGEATSFSRDQRLAVMRAVAEAGLPLARFMVGTGAAALEDAVALTRAAVELGFAGALLLPPFYYKGIDPAGLTDYVAAVIERAGAARLKLYLYNFPQNSGVPYPLEVVQALKQRYPAVLVGLKDSSGDMAYAAAMAKEVPDFDVFPSAEGGLKQAKELGFAGCISATANVTAPIVAEGWRGLGTPAGAKAIEEASAVRAALCLYPVIACTKWALADLTGDANWSRLSPPLSAIDAGQQAKVKAALAATRYGEVRALVAA